MSGTPSCAAFPTEDRFGLACDRCAGPMPPYRRRWCSDRCRDTYWRNHGWTQARWEAIRRATVQVLTDGGRLLLRWVICDQCGRQTGGPEVNHVEPRVGAGYGEGCWNHQTNLQVLCHECHVAETIRQRRERRAPVGAVPLWGSAA